MTPASSTMDWSVMQGCTIRPCPYVVTRRYSPAGLGVCFPTFEHARRWADHDAWSAAVRGRHAIIDVTGPEGPCYSAPAQLALGYE